MVFQNYALYPTRRSTRTCRSRSARKLGRSEIDRRVKRIAGILELEEQLDRRPRQLSGGQRQRVAMGRAMIREPQAFLMDEPLSNLDAKLRTQMRAEISLLHKEIGVTTIYVTHDQVEAMTLGQRVAVMRKGELQQVSSPQELYARPGEPLRGRLHRQPGMNFFEARLESSDGTPVVTFGDGQRLAIDDAERELAGGLDAREGTSVVVGVRPEHLEDAALAASTRPAPDGARPAARAPRLGARRPLRGRGGSRRHRGDARPRGGRRRVDADRARPPEIGTRTSFVGRFAADATTQEDTVAEIAVAPASLRFFDRESGLRLGA